MNKFFLFNLFAFLLLLSPVQAQQLTSSEIYSKIEGLKVLGRVLYIAAHPDDENTRFIAYCANERKLETAYFSFTRGDGGQNLIGKELREDLGLIRTNELMMARSVDGGRQFFSRANDFGYSKNPEETFAIWDREKVLGDLVYIIRFFKPDVIVCRFPTDGRGGHGHHTASAILAEEAFTLSNNESAYPSQLSEVGLWEAKRLVTNTGRWWNNTITDDDPNVVKENIGTYSALQGKSCNEIAALSRSMHKSQGFGSTGTRGEQEEFFEHRLGTRAENSLFDDIDMTWSRIKGGQTIQKQINVILKNYEIAHPEKSMEPLIDLYNLVSKAEQSLYTQETLEKINNLILQASGFYMEAKTSRMEFAQQDSIYVNIELTPRLSSDFEVIKLSSEPLTWSMNKLIKLKKNEVYIEKIKSIVPASVAPTTPYWLKNDFELGNYNLDNQSLVKIPVNKPSLFVAVELKVKGHDLQFEIPILFKETDPVKGEVAQPTYVIPDVNIEFEKEIELVTTDSKRTISLNITSEKENVSGKLNFKLPRGWQLISEDNLSTDLIVFKKKGEKVKLNFSLIPMPEAQSGDLSAYFETTNGKIENNRISRIQYDHIPYQNALKKAKIRIEKINLKIEGKTVGYLMGAGDEGPEAIRLMGYDVVLLTSMAQLSEQKFDAVVVGVRALNTIESAESWMIALLKYTEEGGNLLVQYNTNHSLNTQQFAPYRLKLSRDRITDEKAEVVFLNESHPSMVSPNKITSEDFEDWVQERGLYFPNEWSEEFEPLLQFSDPKEKPTKGALLIAKYGKGNYIYTGLSFFRQFPEGVPGAYRLFANLISLGHE